MKVNVTLDMTLDFGDLDNLEEVTELICTEMSPSEILEVANNQGSPCEVNVWKMK